MNAALIILRILLPKKELKILLGVMLALIMLPALGMTVIAQAPAATLMAIFGTSNFDSSSEPVSQDNPAPSGIAILGGFTYPGDTYALGNCTYWVFARRAQVGEPIPTTWGNAVTWASRAQADGYVVDHTPTQYAIMQIPNVAGGLGHVAFVESIGPGSTWNISEMNVLGLYIVDHKNMPASAAASYNFIHTKG
jgi:surface antigen